MRTVPRLALWISFSLLLPFLFPVFAHATQDATLKVDSKSYRTAHCGPEAPRIDGRLDDPCWQRVEWAGDFTQWRPSEGEPPSQPTSFKILYDERNLYVGFRAWDSNPDAIVDRLERRDWFPGDWVEINIDSYGDDRTAFSFTASVSGTRGDEFISEDGDNWDGSWDPVWELETQIDDEGWTAEVRIPLSQLRFADRDEHTWGIQVQRRVFREDERSLWQPKRLDQTGWVSLFGDLEGIRGIGASRQVELLPYVVAKGERFEAVDGDPFRDGADTGGSLGLDGKVGVTSDLTLNFTLNPDFGQVEADPSEVNLSAFETFFQERRPFFVEGRNIFDFRLAPAVTGGSFTQDRLFYSRRIGAAPHGHASTDDGEFAEPIDGTSILGAAKLSGKTRNGLSIGIMESVSAEERAEVRGPNGSREEVIEPLTNYFVGRMQQDFRGGQSQLGGIFTAVHRDLSGTDLGFLHRQAYSGGTDFRHAWRDRRWYVEGSALFSQVRGSADAIAETQTSSRRYFQRPDNGSADFDPDRTSLSGWSGSVRVGHSKGQGLRFQTGVATRSPGFEINDVGFQRSADEVNQFTWAGYSWQEPFSIFRNLAINTNQWVDWDYQGTNLRQRFNVNFNAGLRSNWYFGAGTTRTLDQVSNTNLRGGPSSRWPGETTGWFWVNSDARRSVQLNFGGEGGKSDDSFGSWEYWWSSLVWRPQNSLRLSVNPTYSINEPRMQYVDTVGFGDEDRYLFGRLEQKTFNLTFRLDYTVSPNFTVQYYGSPFISSGAYDGFRRITNPRAEDVSDRYADLGPGQLSYDEENDQYVVDEDGGGEDYRFDRPDFDFGAFNSNLVLRWEYSAGSTLFLVWSQSRVGFRPDGDFSIGDDLDSLFGTHPRNVFLLKLNKWFSL